MKDRLFYFFLLVVSSQLFQAFGQPSVRPYCDASRQFTVTPGAVSAGDQVNLSFWVGNFSSTAASSPMPIQFFIAKHKDFNPSSDLPLSQVFTLPSIPANQAQNFTASNLQIPPQNVIDSLGGSGTFWVGMVLNGQYQNVGDGCDRASFSITNSTPDIQVTDSVLPSNDLVVTFGDVADDGAGNATGVATVTLINKGKGALTINNITLSGSTAFSVVHIASSTQNFIQPASLPKVIGRNGSENWVVTLRFDPIASGPANGTLAISSNDPDTPMVVVSLTGNGVPVPNISLTTPAAVETDFGGVVQDGVGGFQTTRTISLQNTGTGPLVISQNGIAFVTGAHFSLISVISSAQGPIDLTSGTRTIAALGAEIWNLVVRFDPTALGQLKDGLRIASNDPDQPAFTISFRGTGLNPMKIEVADSSGAPNDRTIVFPEVHADGPGKERVAATITLKNSGDAPLTISQNGLAFSSGVHFVMGSITSDIAGAIDLSTGSKQIAGGNSEIWTAKVWFDPSTGGSLNDKLTILSDDIASPSVAVALSGLGVVRPALAVADSVAPFDDLAIPFGAVLNDGPGGRDSRQTLELKNPGVQPLIVGQNGFQFSGGAGFKIVSVISSTRGPLDISSPNTEMRTIAPGQAEMWTVTLVFDPITDGPHTGLMEISSNDTIQPVVRVSLSGSGATPAITLTSPSIALNVSAGSVFNLKWEDDYPAGNATIALFLDTDTDPSSGLIPIATGISEDDTENFLAWRVDAALAGGNYHVYATITDGSLTRGSYAPGTLQIDAAGAFQLRSSREVTSPDYAYEYLYHGQLYQGVTHLSSGDNTVTVSNPLANGGVATFQFGVKLVPSLVHHETRTYDKLNRVIQSKNGNGITTTLTYDPMGRVVQRASSNGAVVNYTYNVLGRRTSMTDYTGATFYEWDDLNRSTAVITSKNMIKGDSDDLAMRYEYDLAGLRTAIVYPGGERIQYTYDDAGRMLTVNNVTRNLLFLYTYNPTNGLLTKLARPNGIDTLYSYDGMGRVTALRHQRNNGELVAEFLYALDAAGKATNMQTTLPGGIVKREQYSYDRFDRLVEAVYADDGVIDANDKTVNYTYDGNGNRLTMVTKTNNTVIERRNYHYGNENRLLMITDESGITLTEYRYDAAGNCVQKITPEKTAFYSYDEQNLLTSALDGTNYIIFAYNGDGQRIAKTVNGVFTTFVLDANRPVFETVQERDAVGEVSESHTFGDRRLSISSSGRTDIELSDRLGSVRYHTEVAGTIAETYRYDAFGKATPSTGNLSSYTFDGERFESDLGLIFLRTRYFDPDTGRFLSKDPLGVQAGANGYLYCGGDPINQRDPLGQDGEWADNFGQEIMGFGDSLTFGGSKTLRQAILGKNDPANYDSTYYKVGEVTGIVAPFLFGLGEAASVRLANPGSRIVLGEGSAGAAVDRVQRAGIYFGAEVYTSTDAARAGGFNAMMKENAAALDAAREGGKIFLDVGRNIERIADPGKFYTWLEGPYMDAFGIASKNVSSSLNYIDNALAYSGLMGVRGLFDLPSPVGGVLLDKAAQLVGSNLSDLRGAVYDPVSRQFVFLGTEGSAAVKDIDLDYLYTALQAVYGSATPPFVTLDPPASAYTPWADYGNGNGVFEPGEDGGFVVRYNPIWSQEDTTVDVIIRAESSGANYEWRARFDCVTNLTRTIPWGQCMQMVFNSWISSPPPGVTLDTNPWIKDVSWRNQLSCVILPAIGEDTYTWFTLRNGSSVKFLVKSAQVVPARQHRKYGGRVEGTKVGWVMLEADRVMKCLTVGKDNLTGDSYNSGTITVPGYQNMRERLQISGRAGGNIRFWFTPNEMLLKRHLDAETGLATIVFDRASVALNTESFLQRLEQPPEAKAFADHFTANYEAFAGLSFPCVDPNDPTGQGIVRVKIFDMLKDVMQAVSLARFFRDNNVPVDMWWLNSWQPPVAYSPRSTPTAYDEVSGVLIYGGVQVNLPNTYVPSATAKSVAELVQSARPDANRNANGDVKEQTWTANTTEGPLRAVAAQTAAEPQDGNLNLAEVDLTFASPGTLPLQFVRYYHSSWLGRQKMGPGWRNTRFALEFERPSWFDENRLMKTATGQALGTDDSKDTRLRSGIVRVVDLRSGAALDFVSSLNLGYAVDNIGNASITVSGLNSNNVPSFAPGLRQSGGTLVQETNQMGYLLTTPDGAQVSFDHEGHLLKTKDRNGMALTYNYDSRGSLTNIVDMAGQTIELQYDSNQVISVKGPAGEQVNYTYTTNGCLARATHVRSGAFVGYEYNANCQLIRKTLFNGMDALAVQPDLKGRPELASDMRNNLVEKTFTQDDAGSVRTTETRDPEITDPAFQPYRRDFDRTGRLLATSDATGAETLLGYDEGSLVPNYIDLPIPGRPTIRIERNELGQPTRVSDPGNLGARDFTAVYDSTSRLLRYATNEAGLGTELVYDANKNLARVRRQFSGQTVETSFGYYASGALRTKTNERGVQIATIYRDALDRTTNIVDATGVAIRYEYDALGRRSKVIDPRLSGPIEYSYDNFDRVIKVQSPAGPVFYSYDPVKGWLVGQTDLLGRVTSYVRDPQTGDILQTVDVVASGNNRVTAMTYNRFGQMQTVTPPDSQTISFNYDDLGRPIGSSELDANPPGAPKALSSSTAKDGIPTTSNKHVFFWGAPDCDSGIAGYSYALDQTPLSTTNTIEATVVLNNVTIGAHNFKVMALGNNGLWGPSAVFHLIVTNPPPHLEVSPASLDFGAVTIGHTNILVFALTNSGGQTLSGTAVAGGAFTVKTGSPYTLAPGEGSQVSVSFTPISAGSLTGAVTFASNGGNLTNFLGGVGLTPPQLAVSPTNYSFGVIATGIASQATFLLTNQGGTTLHGSVAAWPPFAILGETNYTVAGFGSTTVVVTFTPLAEGVFATNVIFTSDGGTLTNAVDGQGAVIPAAHFIASPNSGLAPLLVNFTDTSSGTITNRAWDFGDGTILIATSLSLTHNYPAAGTNTVSLIVRGPLGANTNIMVGYIVATNPPPLTPTYHLGTWMNQTNSISVAKLIATCSDPLGFPLSLTALNSSNSLGTAFLSSSFVVYKPLTGFTGIDNFTYTMTDSIGTSATGTVIVTVTSPPIKELKILGTSVDRKTLMLHITGIPSETYQIEVSIDLITWTTIGQSVSGTNGDFLFTDPNINLVATRYYRVAQ